MCNSKFTFSKCTFARKQLGLWWGNTMLSFIGWLISYILSYICTKMWAILDWGIPRQLELVQLALGNGYQHRLNEYYASKQACDTYMSVQLAFTTCLYVISDRSKRWMMISKCLVYFSKMQILDRISKFGISVGKWLDAKSKTITFPLVYGWSPGKKRS